MANKTGKGAWKPGQSGNPKGRPPKWASVQGLRDELSKHMPAITKKLVAAAKAGDVQAIRLVLERTLPALKAIEPTAPVQFNPEATLTDQGKSIMAAIAAGDIAVVHGAQLLAALGHLSKASEIDELSRRLAALEESRGTK